MSARGTGKQGASTGTAHAVILYDDLESMLVANELLGRLPLPPGGAGEWTVNSWRFDMLEWGMEGQTALRDAAAAELMVLAMKDATEVEYWPEEWLAHWAAGRRVAAAQLALVPVRTPGSTEPGPGLIKLLRQLAGWANLRLLVLDQSGVELYRPAGPCASDGRLRPLSRATAGDRGKPSAQHFAEVAKPQPESGSAMAPLWAVNF